MRSLAVSVPSTGSSSHHQFRVRGGGGGGGGVAAAASTLVLLFGVRASAVTVLGQSAGIPGVVTVPQSLEGQSWGRTGAVLVGRSSGPRF